MVPVPTLFGTELSQIILAQSEIFGFLMIKGIINQAFYSRFNKPKAARSCEMDQNTNFISTEDGTTIFGPKALGHAL